MFSKAERIRDKRKVERLVLGDSQGSREPQTQSDMAMERTASTADHQAALAEVERQAFEAGYAQGVASNATEVKERLARLAETVEQLAALRGVIVREAEQQLVLLASAIAGRILRSEVTTDPTRLLAIAHAAVERLGERTQATIHLHPDDHAAISNTPAAAQHTLKVVPDPHVQPGGCQVQSEVGTIEAGVAAQLHELTAMLLDDQLPVAEEGRPSAEAPAA